MGKGIPSWSGDGGSPLDAALQIPRTVYVGADNSLYVADLGNNRVRVVNGSTNIVSTIAGTNSGPGSSAFINHPRGIALDPTTGTLFVAEIGNDEVRKFSLQTKRLTDYVDQLVDPNDLALDTAGDLYIVEINKHRVQKVNTTTGAVTTLMTDLRTPLSVYVNSAGVVFVGEVYRIRRREVNGTVRIIAGKGVLGSSPDGTLASNAYMGHVYGIFEDTVLRRSPSPQDSHDQQQHDEDRNLRRQWRHWLFSSA